MALQGGNVEERYEKGFPVSWEQLHRDARALAWRLHESGPFTSVVAVTRGGLVPAAIVARELGIRVIDTACIASYDYGTQGDAEVLKGPDKKLVAEGKSVVIVDDLADTGKTGRVIRELLPEAHFATVYVKPKGLPVVDTFITEVSQDTWIYLPWDMGLQFTPPIRDGAVG